MEAYTNKLQIINDHYKDWLKFLISYNQQDIAHHSLEVANLAKKIASVYDVRKSDAYISGCLHDLGNIFSNGEILDIADYLGIVICDEERRMPLLLHQKLSSVLAKDIFKINNLSILNAIECHTTLKKNPSQLDLTLFVSDKLAIVNLKLKEKMNKALLHSLERAAYVYMQDFMDNRTISTVLHPWLIEGYQYLEDYLEITQKNT